MIASYLAAMVGLLLVDSIWLFTTGPSVLRMTERIQGGPVSFRIAPADARGTSRGSSRPLQDDPPLGRVEQDRQLVEAPPARVVLARACAM